jgi:predicted phage terminase large subunit-like protein
VYTDYDNADREAAARAFYEAHRAEMDRGAESLWPERESVYDLMALRVTIGHAAFESEKQGSPVNPEACEWPEEYFDRPGFWFDEWPKDLVLKAMALDPSKGADAKRGDFAAYVWGGLDGRGVVYLDAELLHCDVAKLVDVGVERVALFRPDVFAVEVNQFQSLLCAEFDRVSGERKVNASVLPLDNRVNKEVRIRRLGPLLSQRRLRFKARSPGAQLLVQQCKDFPVGDHDDGPDAAEMLVRALIALQQGRAAAAQADRIELLVP